MKNVAKQKERILWIDIAKGLGMILVVVGHSRPPQLIYEAISSFHMPLFFFLSGFVYRVNSSFVSMKKRMLKDITKLVLPYIITVCFIGVFLLIINFQGRNGFYESLYDLGKSSLFGSGSNYYEIKMIGEIWFLLAMFWTRRLMDGLFFIQNSILRLTLLVIGAAFSIFLASKEIWLATNFDIALVSVLFMYCGYLFQKRSKTKKKLYFWCAIIVICLYALAFSMLEMSNRSYYHLWYLSLPGAIAMSILISKLSMLLSKIKGLCLFLSYIGRHSLLFLCIHSLDWRMPFPPIGQSLITQFSSKSWYWLLCSIHRFCFDFFVMLIILGITSLFQRLQNSLDPKGAKS